MVHSPIEQEVIPWNQYLAHIKFMKIALAQGQDLGFQKFQEPLFANICTSIRRPMRMDTTKEMDAVFQADHQTLCLCGFHEGCIARSAANI